MITYDIFKKNLIKNEKAQLYVSVSWGDMHAIKNAFMCRDERYGATVNEKYAYKKNI